MEVVRVLFGVLVVVVRRGYLRRVLKDEEGLGVVYRLGRLESSYVVEGCRTGVVEAVRIGSFRGAYSGFSELVSVFCFFFDLRMFI